MPVDLKDLITEVQDGLSTEAKRRMGDAQEALHYYAYEAERYCDGLVGSGGEIGMVPRTYRPSGLLREVVNVLTDHLYSPGPSRTWSEPAGDELLQRVYSDNHVDTLMLRCDQLSTIGDASAIQVDADAGDFAGKPITLRVWGPDEFHAWEDPDDRTRPVAVVTKDKYDQTTRYRLWTAEEVLTFITDKGGGTSGGRVARQIGREDHGYGCLPFAFTHYDYPVQTFWESGPGDLLVDAEEAVNDRLARVNQAIHSHLFPIPVLYNATPGIRITIEPQRFIALPGPKPYMGEQGVQFMDGPRPDLLQAIIDVAGSWEDLRGYILQVLEAVGVPQSAVRMEQSGVASGISLMVEQAPLLTRAEKRRGPWGIYETDLARVILTCIGNYYGRGDALDAAKAGKLSLGWPESRVPVQTEDWLVTQRLKVEMGLSSLIMVAMAMYGCTRERAVEILEQVKEDQDEIERINPDLAAQPPQAAMDLMRQNGQPNGQGVPA